jgi:pyoverdine/dityrosine biosynthesis protein Dit1
MTNHTDAAKRVFACILEISNAIYPPETDCPKGSEPYFSHHLKRIAQSTSIAAPIHFILPAFPAKSPNPNKTFGYLPDYGEVLALKRLDTLCSRICEVYSPGAFITLCSDGRVFNDLVEAPDWSVDEYSTSIRQIIESLGLKSLFTYSLEDAYATSSDYPAMRTWLTDQFSTSPE